MPGNENPRTVALCVALGPLVRQSSKWPPLLAYGIPGIVAVLLIVLLRSAVPGNVAWLLSVVILAPLVGYIATAVDTRHRPPSLQLVTPQRPRATIDAPSPNQIVVRTIPCNGSATGIQPDMHLWLAVEANGFIWPKEGEVYVDTEDRWSATIFEDGAAKEFSVALLIANAEADKVIRAWLEKGQRKGRYAVMKGISGTERLARADGLRLNKSPYQARRLSQNEHTHNLNARA